GNYTVLHEAAKLGDLSQLKLILQNNPHIDINDSCNEYRQTPLHLAINNKHWDVARYCIEKGAWIDVREGAINASVLRTPFENIMELIMKHKNDKNNKEYLDAMDMCKWILKQRTIYPMKRIEYAMDYVKDKLVDEEGITKSIDEENYETLLQEGVTSLLGVSQNDLKETVIKSNLLYWAASRNVKAIEAENTNKKRFDEGWYPLPFLITRIFLLFEICIRLKREGRNFIGLPRGTTFEQMYEKGMKELQVQLTTYWDYIITDEFKHKCPNLIEDWSCNVVDRLMNMKTISSNKCNEMSLVVGHKDHCIYLSLCKTSDSILVRVDNRWMETVPSNTPHPKNESDLIQPYLVAYFQWNGSNIDQNKEWLKGYIKNVTKFRESDSKKSMKHLYCNGNNESCFPPREVNVLSIVKHWPYRPIQTNAQNCYMRSHNVGYRIRLGDVIYQWFRNQEGGCFLFNKSNYNMVINEDTMSGNTNKVKGDSKSNALNESSTQTPSHSKLMELLSKQLKVPYEEVCNGIAVEQALVAKANIHTIQTGAFYRRDASTNQIYFQLYLNSTERIHFYRFYKSKFPKFIKDFKEIDKKWVQFYFDTNVFHYQVITFLSPVS
ncbi:hypothetical protein RFI_25789, partial [Reticulomyxa filosa]